ncbi:MAG: tetratricopeptide repeat protein [Candidatus Kariarchaeaceae archaeon]|jgi:tetratricopeptide (TPR) repeat protein
MLNQNSGNITSSRDFEEVVALYHSGQLDKAFNKAQELLNRDITSQNKVLLYTYQSLIKTDDDLPGEGLEYANVAINQSNKPSLEIYGQIAKAHALIKSRNSKESLKTIKKGFDLVSDSIDKSSADTQNLRAWLHHLMGSHGRYFGNLVQAIESYNESIKIRENSTDIFDLAGSYNQLGLTHYHKGNLEDAVQCYLKSIPLYQELNNSSYIIKLSINIGLCYWKIGDLEQAIKYYVIAKELNDEIQNDVFAGVILMNLGLISSDKGALNDALNYYQECVALLLKQNNLDQLQHAYNNIGIIHDKRGELNKALEYYSKSFELCSKLGDQNLIERSYHNLGITYRKLQNYDTAHRNFTQSLELARKLDHPLHISDNLYDLIITDIHMGNTEKAESHMAELTQIANSEDNIRISILHQLSRANLLKIANRIIDQAQAIKIFKEIVEEENIYYDLKIEAMIHLSDLLVVDLIATKNEDIVTEAISIIDKIYNYATKEHSTALIIESLVLRSKYALLQDEVTEADGILKRALELAKKHKLSYILTKVETERKNLEKDLEKWNELARRGAPILERVEAANLDEYIERLKKIKKGEEKDEEEDEENEDQEKAN